MAEPGTSSSSVRSDSPRLATIEYAGALNSELQFEDLGEVVRLTIPPPTRAIVTLNVILIAFWLAALLFQIIMTVAIFRIVKHLGGSFSLKQFSLQTFMPLFEVAVVAFCLFSAGRTLIRGAEPTTLSAGNGRLELRRNRRVWCWPASRIKAIAIVSKRDIFGRIILRIGIRGRLPIRLRLKTTDRELPEQIRLAFRRTVGVATE